MIMPHVFQTNKHDKLKLYHALMLKLLMVIDLIVYYQITMITYPWHL